MFTFLIFSFEMAILAYVYWLVFLKQPEIYKVDQDVWGCYAGAHQKTSQSVRLMFSDQFPTGMKSEKILRS